jgi:cysteine desulfurase
VSTEIYLDNNATTPPLAAVTDEVVSGLQQDYGNPSSPHGRGQSSRAKLAQARERVAALLGAHSDQVIFTAGATEGNNTVLKSILGQGGHARLITTPVEHSSVLKVAEHLAARGVAVTYLDVDPSGRVTPDQLRAALSEPADLVSIQWANSETGVLQPIAELREICQKYGVPLHVDAAQAVGRMPINLAKLPIDYLTFTGHKLHGPQGTGALFARDRSRVVPLLHGGDQEHDRRAGTENVPGIAGFGRAATERDQSLDNAVSHMQALRDRFEEDLLSLVEDVFVNGDRTHRVCNTSNIRFAGIEGQALMAQLDRQGIICSQTSACTSQRPEPSYVLRTLGLSNDEAFASVRFSFSVLNTAEEVDRAVDSIAEVCDRLRSFARMAG